MWRIDRILGFGVTQTGVNLGKPLKLAHLRSIDSFRACVCCGRAGAQWVRRRVLVGETEEGKQEYIMEGFLIHEGCVWIIIFLCPHFFFSYLGNRKKRKSSFQNGRTDLCFQFVSLWARQSPSVTTSPLWDSSCTLIASHPLGLFPVSARAVVNSSAQVSTSFTVDSTPVEHMLLFVPVCMREPAYTCTSWIQERAGAPWKFSPIVGKESGDASERRAGMSTMTEVAWVIPTYIEYSVFLMSITSAVWHHFSNYVHTALVTGSAFRWKPG